MKAKVTWVVIANGAHARIAMNAGVGKGLKPAMSREFAAPHVPNRRLVSDRPGRHPGTVGPRTHGLAPRSDHHALEKLRFVREIATAVDRALERRRFDRLVLVAPPTTLGALRHALGPASLARVTARWRRTLPTRGLIGWRRTWPIPWPLKRLAEPSRPAAESGGSPGPPDRPRPIRHGRKVAWRA